MSDQYEDPNRRGVMLDKKKLTIINCYECGTPLMMACLCKSCAIKSGKFIEPKK